MVGDIIFIPNPLLEFEVVRTPEVHLLVASLAQEVAGRASAKAPRRTGRLAASLRVENAGLGQAAEAQVIADTPYSGFVEFGTSDTPAQAFLRPALDGVIPGRTA
jgi:HK97 gp10 family phage protein